MYFCKRIPPSPLEKQRQTLQVRRSHKVKVLDKVFCDLDSQGQMSNDVFSYKSISSLTVGRSNFKRCMCIYQMM